MKLIDFGLSKTYLAKDKALTDGVGTVCSSRDHDSSFIIIVACMKQFDSSLSFMVSDLYHGT